MQFKPSFSLTVAGYWDELEELSKKGTIPAPLAACLKSLINSQCHATITTTATEELVRLVREHLPNGIMLSDPLHEVLYDVMVFVPDGGQESQRRSFFRLMPKYPGGKFKYVKDL